MDNKMTKEPIMIDEKSKEEIKQVVTNLGNIRFTVEDELKFCKEVLKRKEQECEKFKEENKLAKEIITKAVVDFSIEYGTKQYGRLLEGAKLLGIEV